MRDFRRLDIWKRSIDLTEKIYLLTKDFSSDEKFGLISQLRRASISISSNIAEGCGRRTRKELIRFLDCSSGSIMEIESQLVISERLGYLDSKVLNELVLELREIARMISGFIKYVSEGGV